MTFVILIIIWTVLLSLELMLCYKENKSGGLIIPIISFVLSFYCLFAANHFLIALPDADPIFIESMSIYAFICSNFPTIIYIVIYIIGRLIVYKKNHLKKIKNQKL